MQKVLKTVGCAAGLVVFQFSISIILIIGTIVIYNQLDYIRSRKIGYNRDQVFVLHNAWYLDKQIHTFRNELLNIPGVTNATVSGDLPTGPVLIMKVGFAMQQWMQQKQLY